MMAEQNRRSTRKAAPTAKMKSLMSTNYKQMAPEIATDVLLSQSVMDEECDLKTTDVTNPSTLTDKPDPMKRTVLDAFIKVIGCRKVTIETLSADGKVIKSDVKEVDDDPEIIKISTQQKLSDDVSQLEVQKPENFLLSHQFLGRTNFTTTMAFKCPKFVKGGEERSEDPVFVSLNKETSLNEPSNSVGTTIQVLRADIDIQMNSSKADAVKQESEPSLPTVAVDTPSHHVIMPLASKKADAPQKATATKSSGDPETQNAAAKQRKKRTSKSEVLLEESPVSREGKRLRKPSTKLMEMQEAHEMAPEAEARKVANGCNAKSSTKMSTRNKKERTRIASSAVIKIEPGHPVANNTNFNTSVTTNEIIDDEVVKSESLGGPSEPNTESANGNDESSIVIPELLAVVKDEEEGESVTEDMEEDMNDFTIFDDDVYEKKYGTKHKAITRVFSCTYCTKSFNRRPAWRKHLLNHRKKNKVQHDVCNICQKTFINPYVYECHLQTHKNQTDDGNYKCHACGKTYISRSSLLKHHRVGKGKACAVAKYECEFCHCCYSSERSLEIHKRRHLDVPLDRTEVCFKCGKTFETRGGLNKHAKNKDCDQRLTCNFCEKVFNNEAIFNKHVKIHTKTPNETTICDQCGKVFACAKALRFHKNSHMNIRDFSCTFCDKSFVQKGTLVAHERVHTGAKPYLCSLCGSSFRYSSHLKQHTYIHTGENPYPCTKCERAFNNKNSLIKHLLSHTNREKRSLLKDQVKELPSPPEYINISNVSATEEIVFLNEVPGDEEGATQYIYTMEDGQQIQGYLASASDTIVASENSQIQYQDDQGIIYQAVEGENVTIVDEMQTSDLNILAETAQNYESPGVTYVIVKK